MLPVIGANRAAEVHQPPRALVPNAGDRLEHIVEATQLTQRRQRAPIGRVLPRSRANAGEHDATVSGHVLGGHRCHPPVDVRVPARTYSLTGSCRSSVVPSTTTSARSAV